MRDQKFLQYALKQSFLHPQSIKENGLEFLDCVATADGLVIRDNHNLQLPICFLPRSTIAKNMRFCGSEAKNNLMMIEQLQVFKHDLCENIMIPDNIPQVKEAQQECDMPVVNRQSAQKKKLVATIFPVSFTMAVPQMTAKYQQISQQIAQILKNNPEFFDLVLVQNFAVQYRKIMRKCHSSHLIFWLNKKRFISYLCEAIQLLKNRKKLADDFYLTHSFIGQNCPWSADSAKHCMARLRILIGLLQPMAQKPQILRLAQTAIADYKKFRDNIKNTPNNPQSSKLYDDWQKCFMQYAQICYLDGVRRAFEYDYLDELPIVRNPPLPTVAPQEELKKIGKIIAESQKTVPYNGKINKLYLSAKTSYEKEIKELVKNISAI